jgi:branched-chain amino acid transport system ATP-binding protein
MRDEAIGLNGVSAGYGTATVLDGMSLSIAKGETVAILGRNGVGKTTLLATLMGRTRQSAGELSLNGRPISHWPIWKRARSGLALVPQEREIFPSLTVEQNLTVAKNGTRWPLARVYELFGRLQERRGNLGNQLSGGEQQMLAVARALMGSPDVLMLDEPLEGLAPVIVDALMKAMRELRDAGGMTLLLVEQHARLALEFAPRAIVLVRGRIAYDGPSQTLLDDHDRLHQLIGVAGDTRPVIPAEETTTLETIA